MNRYGHLYATDNNRVANALESAYVDGLIVASPVPELRSADNALTNSVAGGAEVSRSSGDQQAETRVTHGT